MSEDARFEDASAKPLNLGAMDPDVLRARAALGTVMLDRRRLTELDEELDALLPLLRQTLGERDVVTLEAVYTLGWLRAYQQRPDEALPHLLQAAEDLSDPELEELPRTEDRLDPAAGPRGGDRCRSRPG